MLQEKLNEVKIEGVLSEISLDYKDFKTKTGAPMKAVGGFIKVRVEEAGTIYEIPVHMFAGEMTTKGTKNPAYESIERVMNEYKSIALAGADGADCVRITKGKISMNEYYNQNGALVSFPRITASFVNKIKKDECHPEATFGVIFQVGSKGYDKDKDGVEIPNHYKIGAALPQYGGKVDVVPFYLTSPKGISDIEQYWNVGDTVKAYGKLNFTSKVVTQTVDVDFGEPREETHTTSISELVITSGSRPLEGDFAFDANEIAEGLKIRQAKLAELKAKASAKSAPKTTFSDLGF